MPFSPEIAVIAVPMAVYLYALGLLHGGKHPRVVSGTADLAMLIASLSGLVAFGPVGQVVVGALFGPDATVLAWSTWFLGLTILAGLLARTGRRRLVIYHAPADAVRPAVESALAEAGGSFAPTLQGFEDPTRQTAILVRAYPRTRTAVVEGQGDGARATIAALQPRLRDRFRAIGQPVSAISTAFFTASALVMLVPVAGFILLDPAGRRATRTVGRWLGWG